MRILLSMFVSLLMGSSICGASPSVVPKDSKQALEELQRLVARTVGVDSTYSSTSMPGSLGGEMNSMQNLSSVAQEVQNVVTPQVGGVVLRSGQENAQANAINSNSHSLNSQGRENNAQTKAPYDQAFDNMVNQILPMTPEQIGKFREIYNENQLAAATTAGVPPKPTSTLLQVNLSPNGTPPVIRLGAGYITSLVFIDATGQPWPIDSYSIGDPSAFNIQWDRKGNTLLIQSLTHYKRSNMAVILQGLNTPVMITLISGQEAIDYRVDLRIPGYGPSASFSHSGIPEAANPVLLEVLNGVPPEGARELKVKGGICQAWVFKDNLYLRTKLHILSPGWKSVMSSIDGTRAYQTQPVPVILASQNGKDHKITLNVEGL